MQCLRSRRVTRITLISLQCLQLLIANHPDASILVTISAAFDSSCWEFSSSSVASYPYDAQLPTCVEGLNYVEQVAITLKTSSAYHRSVPRIVEIMREEGQGANDSVPYFLSPVEEGSATSEVEPRVQTM